MSKMSCFVFIATYSMPVILSYVLWQDDCIYVDRLTAHYFLHICSGDGAFGHLAPVPENSEL